MKFFRLLYLPVFFIYTLIAHSQELPSEAIIKKVIFPDNQKNEENYSLTKKAANIENINATLFTEIGRYYSSVTAVAINNQGTILAAGYQDGKIRLWDVLSGGVLKEISAHSASITALKFSKNDQFLGSGSDDKSVKIWNVALGSLYTSFTAGEKINCLAFTNSNKKLVAGSGNNLVVFDILESQISGSYKIHDDEVTAIDFSLNELLLVTASKDSLVKVWDSANIRLLLTLKGHTGPVMTVSFFQDGLMVASGGRDSTIRIWNLFKKDSVKVLRNHNNAVNQLSYSLHGNKLFTGGYDNVINIWNVDKYVIEKSIKCNGLLGAIFPEGSRAVLSQGENIVILNLDSNYISASLSGHSSSVCAIALSKDYAVAASGSWDKSVKIWDVKDGRLLKTLNGHNDGVLSLSISPDGERIVSGGFDKKVNVWTVKTGSLLYSFTPSNDFIWKVSFSPDGSLFAASDWGNNVAIWNTYTGRLIHKIQFAGNSIAFSPDGKELVTGGFGLLKIWDVTSGNLIKDLSGLAGEIISLSFSPEGSRFVTGAIDGSLRIWDANGYNMIYNISGTPGEALSVALSGDGSRLAAGGGKTLNLFDAFSGNKIRSFGLDQATFGVLFSNDNKSILTTCDKFLKLYDSKTLMTGKTITGRVVFNNSGLSDTYVELTGSSSGSAVTDRYGYYSFLVTYGGNYQLAPKQNGYYFLPNSTTITNVTSDMTLNFNAELKKIILSGKITQDGNAVSGVPVELYSFSEHKETKSTDISGNYKFSVDANKTYTIIPKMNLYSFEPKEKIFFSAYENQFQDFFVTKQALSAVDIYNIPENTTLYQNYPNPFNPETLIKYQLSKSSIVSIRVYDTLGKEVKTLVSGYKPAGNYEIRFDAAGLASGLYFYKLITGNVNQTLKMILSK